MTHKLVIAASFSALALSGCSLSGSDGTASNSNVIPARIASSDIQMDVTDIDYGSVRTDARYLVSYSFPDEAGQRFAVRATGSDGSLEPVDDTGDISAVLDDVAGAIICKESGGATLRKLQSIPTYVVADRAYQSTYICNSEG